MKCKFGTGQQEMETCPMIYIHVHGYYPSFEHYRWALRGLCPNLRLPPWLELPTDDYDMKLVKAQWWAEKEYGEDKAR